MEDSGGLCHGRSYIRLWLHRLVCRINSLFDLGIFMGFLENNKKIKQRQPNPLKAKLVDLGGEGITYSVISHSDTIPGDICRNPHLNIEPIKNSAVGLYYSCIMTTIFPNLCSST